MILLVEDNPAEVRLFREAFQACDLGYGLEVVRDGEEALDFLQKKKNYTDAARPDLILLDLNLPKKDGREVLETIKQNPELSEIPVLVLSTSGAQDDLHTSYRLHANSYLTKPSDFDEFLRMVGSIDEFWFHHSVLPTRPDRQ
jgi:CheY-like chemotaxis protein